LATSPAQLRYLADAVNTASPAQRVVMLYDRLLLDVRRAGDAQAGDDRAHACEQLRHAQLIVAELRASLQVDQWSGADDLASLYAFVLSELISLNLAPDTERLSRVTEIITGLRDSWRAAATIVQGLNTTSAVVGPDVSVPRQVAWVG
jgi:flagellar secretion chaperone FliS